MPSGVRVRLPLPAPSKLKFPPKFCPIKLFTSFDEFHKFCIEIDSRRKLDKDLDKILKEHKKYNFIEGKKIYEEQEKKY